MHIHEVLDLAANHAREGMTGSAMICLDDAQALAAQGRFEDARRRAERSLAYSVGIYHPDYTRVANAAFLI